MSEERIEYLKNGTGTTVYPYRKKIRSSPCNIAAPGGLKTRYKK